MLDGKEMYFELFAERIPTYVALSMCHTIISQGMFGKF